MSARAHLGLGANVGDPRAQLQAAVDALAERGVATVASIISGTPAACATSARPATSATSPEGFATLSAKTTFVRSVIAAAYASGSLELTNVVSTPNRRRVTSSCVSDPP